MKWNCPLLHLSTQEYSRIILSSFFRISFLLQSFRAMVMDSRLFSAIWCFFTNCYIYIWKRCKQLDHFTVEGLQSQSERDEFRRFPSWMNRKGKLKSLDKRTVLFTKCSDSDITYNFNKEADRRHVIMFPALHLGHRNFGIYELFSIAMIAPIILAKLKSLC